MESEPESGEFECSDNSDDDPSFDVVEETRSALSALSLKKSNAKTRKEVDADLESESEIDTMESVIPKLEEKDEKSFEKVEELIQGGELGKLKVDQCKLYLRKYGLRLTGNKSVLVARIQEHREIIDGRGEKKYPPESFLVNCKGDACLGDVVIFEQNVYDMFSIASRSATGPSCGTRTVAGRIVKESYGAAKQQHTFTIEVLWSKGVKPWPPLHPLLIKGRNLYRIKTMRQMWDNELERVKVLEEKHARGFCARSSRDVRIQMKERRNNGIVIRKNKTSDKENQCPRRGNNIQQKGVASVLQHPLPNIQQRGVASVPQHPLPSILGKPPPELDISSPRAPGVSLYEHRAHHVHTLQAPNSWNFGLMNHGVCQDYHHGRPQRFHNSPRRQHHYNATNHSHHMHQTLLQNHFMHRQQQPSLQQHQKEPSHLYNKIL